MSVSGETAVKDWNFLRPEAHDIIEYFQPYHRDKRPEQDLLAHLEKLANFDKHRVVTPVYSTTSLLIMAGNNIGIPVHVSDFDDQGKYVFAVAIGASETINDFNPPAPLDIGFSIQAQGGIMYAGGYQIGHLTFMHNLIREKMLPRFAGVL